MGEVLENWEKLKVQERDEAAKSGKQSQVVLSTIPAGLPALIQADTYQRRASRVGFDWPDISGVKAKVHEEIAEVEATNEPSDLEDEIGDLLFAVVNWARWLDIDPEAALRRANAKFASRFSQVEAAVQAQGKEMRALTLLELDRLWEEAKNS